MHNGKYECSLFIQTEDKFPVNVNETVRCVVISSLVTTQRKLKAMSLLNSRNQLARAILNPNPMDFCTTGLLTTTSEGIVSDDYMITGKVRKFYCQDVKASCCGYLLTIPMSTTEHTLCAQGCCLVLSCLWYCRVCVSGSAYLLGRKVYCKELEVCLKSNIKMGGELSAYMSLGG